MKIKTLAVVCMVSSFFVHYSWAMQTEEDFIEKNNTLTHYQIKSSKPFEFSTTEEKSYLQKALDIGYEGATLVIRHPVTAVIVGVFTQMATAAAGNVATAGGG